MGCGAVYLGLLLGKAAWAVRGARRAPAAAVPSPEERAGVLVAQPVLSGDPGLADALAGNLRDLAGVDFCWLVDDDDPVGRETCTALAGPGVAVVDCPPAPAEVNPKLWKIDRALAGLPDDAVLVVLDDDTRLPAASLGALLAGLDRAPGDLRPVVATGLPAYLPTHGVWARLVAQFVDDNAATTYLPWTPVTLNGMTWAVRAGDLRALGGLAPVLGSLTDDLAVAGLVLGGGGRIVQTAAPQWIATTVADFRAYAALLHRWMVFATLLMRRQSRPVAARIAVLHGLPPLLLAAVLAGATRRPGSAALVLAVRAVVLAALQRRLYGRVLHRPVLSVLAELTTPLHLAHAAVVRTIVWRTRVYRVYGEHDFRPARYRWPRPRATRRYRWPRPRATRR